MTDEIPDFEAMLFDELMSTDSKDDNDDFNDALWTAQSNRFERFNIPRRDDFEEVRTYQDEIDTRLKNLEAKFERLLKLLDNKTGIHSPDNPLMITVREYVEGNIK